MDLGKLIYEFQERKKHLMRRLLQPINLGDELAIVIGQNKECDFWIEKLTNLLNNENRD